MKDLSTLLAELEVCIEREVAAQRGVVGLIDVQEEAIRSGSPQAITAATVDIEAELRSSAQRGGERQRILAGLAAHWHVAPRSLTLSSIAERCGAAGGRLAELRTELRTTMADVVRRCRRMGALARANGQILNQAIETVLSQETEEQVSNGGTLVNAEA